MRIQTRGSLWQFHASSVVEPQRRSEGEVASQAIFDPSRGAMVFRTWSSHTKGTLFKEKGSLELLSGL